MEDEGVNLVLPMACVDVKCNFRPCCRCEGDLLIAFGEVQS